MRKAFTLLFLLFNLVLMAQGDITKEFQYGNFVKYCDAAKDHMAAERYSKAASSIVAAKFAAKALVRKGYEPEIKPQLDELDVFRSQIDGNKTGSRGSSRSNKSTTSTPRNNTPTRSTPTTSSNGSDITKEFQYENFVKYCDEAKERMDAQMYFKAENSITAARNAARSLISHGFENEIKPQLDKLDQYENQIDGGRDNERNIAKTMQVVASWEETISKFFRQSGSLDYYEKIFNGQFSLPAFDRDQVLGLINTLKASPEYAASTSKATAAPVDKMAMAKERRTRSSDDSPVNRGKVDLLESYILHLDDNLVQFDTKEAIGRKLAEIRVATNKSDMDHTFTYFFTPLLSVLQKIDPNNAYVRLVQQKVDETARNSVDVLAINNFGYKTHGSFSTLPQSAQKNTGLEEEIFAALASDWPGYVLKNAIFIDKDWVIEKDDDGHDFSRSIQVWITVVPELLAGCYVRQTTFIQYYSGTETGETRKYENGKRYAASCDIVDALYVKSGKSKLPISLMTDPALSQKLMAAARNKGSNGDTVIDAILNTKRWGENRDNHGHIISRSRMGIIVYKNSSGNCFYQHFLFKQKASGAGYGSTFIQKTLSRKTQFDCAQLK